MLQRLFIENIALIERLEVEFDSGFNVLTGETGAGKSIVIDAVNLVLGERADRSLIKTGKEKAVVEAVFEVGEYGEIISVLKSLGFEPEDGMISLSRELSAGGKNICRINGVLTTLTLLKSIGDLLIDVHGQHEHQSLLYSGSHLALLDRFGHNQIDTQLQKVAGLYTEYKITNTKLLSRFGDEQERARRMDMLTYQINEIEQAKLFPDEEEELLKERALLMNAEKILQMLERGHMLISGDERGGAASAVRSLQYETGAFVNLGSEYENLNKKLEEAYYLLEDISVSLRDLKYTFDFNPKRLDEVERRLDLIASMKRKYGGSISEILKYRNNAQKELEELVSSDQLRDQLEKKSTELLSEYSDNAKKLSKYRREVSKELEKQIIEQLMQLGFQKPRFEVAFHNVEDGDPKTFRENGIDEAEFLLSVNSGEDLKPLSKVASGGEMSRIMLALKNIVAEIDNIPTLVFDEIDIGISGRIAGVVGEKILNISRTHQVLCVTHQPQIAALADKHLLIQKTQLQDMTDVSIRCLNDSDRINEIARIMGGTDQSDLAAKHANELFERGKKLKNIH